MLNVVLITNSFKTMKKNELINGSAFSFRRWKIILIMKLQILLILGIVFQTFAGSVDAQNKKLNLDFKNQTLKEILATIEKESEFSVIYQDEQVNSDKTYTVKFDQKLVTEVLGQILPQENLDYQIKGRVIVVVPKNSISENVGKQGDVSGKVTDNDGLPLPGVTVVIKGTTQGAVTGINGEFTLSGINSETTLQFSFVGMRSQEIVVGNQSTINITMKVDAIGLEEVVAVGYATQKKVNLTGSVVQVNTDDLASSAVTNTSSALQGKSSGVTVSQNSGLAGEDNSSVKIRGIGTLNAGQDPLVLVDGIQMNMNSVDPMDIENISILKDAASAAIYGSRAANGVILITTKGGKKGQGTNISYNTYFGIQEVTNVPNLLNAYEHAMLYNEALENDGLSTYFSEDDLANLQNPTYVNDINFPNNLSPAELEDFNNNGYYQDVNYSEMNFRKATLQKHYLSIDGGGENSHGRMGVGYINQEGTRVGNDAESYNIKLNYDVSLFEDKLNVYSKLFYYRNEYNKGASSTGGNWHISPWNGYYFPNGLYGGEADFPDLQLGAYNINSRNEVVGLLGARISLVKNLDIVLEYSQIRNYGKNDIFTPERETYNSWEDVTGANRSEISLESQESLKQTGTATATYGVNLSEKSKLTLLGGTSFEEYNYKMFGASRMDLLNNFQPELSLGSSATMMNWSSATDYAMASFFGRANYNFADRYLFEINFRIDGSSRFASGNQWGTFPSASFGWRISEESFMQDASSVDNLKLRLSYGQLGNQNIDNYAARNILSAQGSYPINNELETTVGIGSLANQKITWETTTMANVGIDMNMYEQFSLAFDLYNKVSKDVLYRIAIPGTVGVNVGPYRNIAEVQNTGWDLSLGWDKRIRKDFNVGAYLNLSGYVNEITQLDSDVPVFLDDALDSKTDQYLYVWQEGQPINAFYGYTAGGIASQEDIDGGLLPDQGFDLTAGDLWYKDTAGNDNAITDEDRGIIGDSHPSLIYSLNLTASWKGFDLSFLMEGITGAEQLLYSAMFRTEFKSLNVNKPADLLNRWTPDNLDARFPKVSSLENKTRVSDFYIEDASYLRGKDLTIGYTIPKTTLSKIGLKHVRVYTNFRNLFTLTEFRGLDPETSDFSDTSKSGVVPPSKVYTIGLQVKL